MTWTPTIPPLLDRIRENTASGELAWKRSTRNQVYATVEAEESYRVVLTRYSDRSNWVLAIAAVSNTPSWEATLTISPISEEGEVKGPTISVDSGLLDHYRKQLFELLDMAQELADAPVRSVNRFLDALNGGPRLPETSDE